MTTRILLVRHGETVLAAGARFAGATDAALSDEGRRQARALAERLATAPIRAIYASPMARTMDTAAIIAEPHAMHPVAEPSLKEVDHGRWETLTHDEAERAFPEAYAAWQDDPFLWAPPDGESGLSVLGRAMPSIRTIVRRHEGEAIVVVSHKATIRLVVANLLGIDPKGYRERLELEPAALTVLDVTSDLRAKLILYNDAAHCGQRLW